MTKKQAEAHLAKLARRRARYAERKKQQDMKTVSWDDEFNGRQPEVIAAFQHALVFTDCPEASPEVAPTPREPEQLALALPEPRVLRPMTPEAQREIDLETRNLGRAWIAQILAGMEDA